MPFIPMRSLLDYAAKHKFSVCALNVNNMEQIQAVLDAARATKSPVIIQASKGARKYAQDLFLQHLMLAAMRSYPEILLGKFYNPCDSSTEFLVAASTTQNTINHA